MILEENMDQCCRKFNFRPFFSCQSTGAQIHLITAVIKVISLPVYSRAQGLLMGANQDIKTCCQLNLKAWGDNEGGLESGFSSVQ